MGNWYIKPSNKTTYVAADLYLSMFFHKAAQVWIQISETADDGSLRAGRATLVHEADCKLVRPGMRAIVYNRLPVSYCRIFFQKTQFPPMQPDAGLVWGEEEINAEEAT
jgi:hypothetical protein